MKTIIDFANKVKSLVDGRMSNIANVEESPSTHAYTVGKQLIFNGLLCKATSVISVGDTLAVGTNLALSDNVVEQIYSLNQGLTNSLKNFAPAYSSVSTYVVDDLVTQDGKLYKCIVAVTTPEQFDINKWDDVTTSEVYLRQASVETRLKKVGMNDNSNFTFNNANDYIVLESRADNGKVRAILFDATNNLLKLRRSDYNGSTFTDSTLFPTFVSGQSKNFYGWGTCLIIGNSSAAQIIYNFGAPFISAHDAFTVTKTGGMAIVKPSGSIWTDRVSVHDEYITDIISTAGDGNMAVVITTTEASIIALEGETSLSNYRFNLTKS